MKNIKKVTQDIFIFGGIDPIKANVEVSANFKGLDFEIITLPEECEVHYQTSQGGEMYTKCNALRISFVEPENKDVFFTIGKILEIVDIISLLSGNFYFDTSLTPRYVRFSVGYNQAFEAPDKWGGILTKRPKVDNIQIDNDQIGNFFNRINKLSDEDYGYFRSSANLLMSTKKSLGKGELSKAVVDGVSAIEALYTRQDSTSGNYSDFDKRFITFPKGTRYRNKKKAFNIIFADQKVIQVLNPYNVRSEYLHGGQVLLHQDELPRRINNEYDDFVFRCQEIIISSLDKFTV